MKKLIATLLTLTLTLSVCTCSFAEGDTVTLAELKAQAPESVSFTINGEVYDVPVILPKADAVPVTYATHIIFDANEVWSHYTPQDDTFADTDPHTALLSVSAAPKGKSRRSPVANWESLLLDSETPENNPLNATRPLEKAKELLNMLDVNIELRVLYQRATSRPYHSVQVSDGDHAHPYRFHYEANTAQPFDGYDQGIYVTHFAQLINGVQVLGEGYFPEENDASCQVGSAYSPAIGMRLLAEDDFSFNCFCLLQTTESIDSDPALVSLDNILCGIQQRIDAGTLQNIFAIELCYQPMLELLADNEQSEDAIATSLYAPDTDSWVPAKARIVLIPAWKVLGYDTKDAHVFMEGYGEHPASLESCESFPCFNLRYDAMTGDYLTNVIYQR